jgi:hypothetical protein
VLWVRPASSSALSVPTMRETPLFDSGAARSGGRPRPARRTRRRRRASPRNRPVARSSRSGVGLDRVRGAGDTRRTPGRGGRQNAMKSKPVNAWGGNENGNLLDELQRIEPPRRRAVPSGVWPLVHERPVRAFRHPLQRQGRAQQVAADMLEGFSGVSGEGDIGVKGEALQASTPRCLRVHDGRGRAQTAHGMTGARTARDTLLDGGGGRAGQQAHRLGDGIGGARLLGHATSAAQEATHTGVDRLHDLGDLLVRRRRHRMTHRGRQRGGPVEHLSSTSECRGTPACA